MKFRSLLFHLIFFIPAIADILFTSQIVLSLFNVSIDSWNYDLYPTFLFIGVIVSILLYLLVLLHHFQFLFGIKNRLVLFFDTIYRQYQFPILTSLILSLSTFFFLYLSSFGFSSWVIGDFVIVNLTNLLLKLLAIIILIFVIKVLPQTRLTRAITSLFLLGGIAFATFLLIMILQEFIPQQYFTFPLNDPKGKYVINYDGDYWLTYYLPEQQCTVNGEGQQNCIDIWVKKGNTSITESPVELGSFQDRSVLVQGEFVPTHGSIMGDKKKLCLGIGFKKQCMTSTGPGIWYVSPLKIKSIRLE